MMEDDAELAVGLSVTCSTTIDECYVVDVERGDETCASTSDLSFGVVPFMTKTRSPTATPVALVCSNLGSYEIPLVVNQRSGTKRDKNQNEDIIVESEEIDITAPLITIETGRQKHKQKQKTPLKKSVVNTSYSSSREEDPQVSDYSTKNRKAFFCRACGKAFKFQTSLLRHNNKVHISKYQCPTCSRLFSRQAYLDVHTSKQGSTCFLGNYTSNKTQNRATTADTYGSPCVCHVSQSNQIPGPSSSPMEATDPIPSTESNSTPAYESEEYEVSDEQPFQLELGKKVKRKRKMADAAAAATPASKAGSSSLPSTVCTTLEAPCLPLCAPPWKPENLLLLLKVPPLVLQDNRDFASVLQDFQGLLLKSSFEA